MVKWVVSFTPRPSSSRQWLPVHHWTASNAVGKIQVILSEPGVELRILVPQLSVVRLSTRHFSSQNPSVTKLFILLINVSWASSLFVPSHKYYWGNQIRKMRLAGHVARMEEKRGADRGLDGKAEGKGPLGWSRHRWEDNIKTCKSDVWLTVHRNSVWIRKTN
jgi:hypothetical protein